MLKQLTKPEQERLRRLANDYMQAAVSSVHNEKITLWKALNRGAMQRPMVMVDQLPWNELAENEELALQVTVPFWRDVECSLTRSLYQWKHFPVDLVLEPYISLPMAAKNSRFGMMPLAQCLGEDGTTAYSQHFVVQLKKMEEVQQILDIQITHNTQETQERLEAAQELFGDLAPIRMRGLNFHLGVWDFLSQVMGPDQVLYALLDKPELVHAAMDRLTQSTLCGVRQAQELGVLDSDANLCHCSHIYTDELLPGSGAGLGPLAKNCWGMGLAQILTAVSPAMFAEFELPYIQRMAEPFGMLYYGCCDRMDDRLDYVRQIPNVRKISCSPWSDKRNFAQQIGQSIVMSNKPTPAYLGTTEFNEDMIRSDLEETYAVAKENKVNLEFILKDVSTVRRDPARLDKWAKIAMEVAQS